MRWLEGRLAKLGYGDRRSTIVAREPMRRASWIESYEVYYTVRVEP